MKPQTNIAIQNYTNTGLVEEWTNWNYTQEPDSSNFAKEGSNGVDGLGETYSSHSKLRHREPNNPDTPSHHAPTPPSLNPAPSESSLEPPGDLSPSSASKIVTETPSLLSKEERKACSAALSPLVHTSPSGPCAAWNVLLSTWNRLGEESVEESGMVQDSSSVMGERGGGLGVGGLCPVQGGGLGMTIDRLGGAEADRTWSGIGSPSPLQTQHKES